MKNHFNELKGEIVKLICMLIAVIIVLRLAFWKESLLNAIKISLALYWIFAVPGYFAMLRWKDKLGFAERFVAGTVMSAAVIGILSYYAGIMGFNVNYHKYTLPLIVSIAGFVFYAKKSS